MAHLKRILQDYRALQREPLPLAAAAPRDSDTTLWDGLIGVELDGEVCPLHFLIDFPTDYPRSAPSVGFSFAFPYSGGASYTKTDGRLAGKFVVCLDLLGNFDHVHTEWKAQTGTGWSPAYSVTTLLLQLQSVLASEQWGRVGTAERARMRQQAEAWRPAGLALRTHAELAAMRDPALLSLCRGDAALADRTERFVQEHGVDRAALLSLLAGFTGAPDAEPTGPAVDPNIVCFATGAGYKDAVLGMGVRPEGKNLATAAELLSLEAFDGGLRQGTDKAPFTWFLPAWVNQAHAERARAALEASVCTIGEKAFGTRRGDLSAAAMEVFPRLVNQMIVEIMRPDAAKTAAIAFFEALANFWRAFRDLVERHQGLRDAVRRALTDFVGDEAQRHKDRCADLGMVLALYSVYQGLEGCPAPLAFARAYLDENFVRNVMWWRRGGSSAAGPDGVFRATQVSREIFLFQQMVRRVLVGDDVAATLAALEATNCTVPDRLEELQRAWRAQKAAVQTWPEFFEAAGVPSPSRGVQFWLERTEARADEKGPKYTFSGGKGKGKGKGKW